MIKEAGYFIRESQVKEILRLKGKEVEDNIYNTIIREYLTTPDETLKELILRLKQQRKARTILEEEINKDPSNERIINLMNYVKTNNITRY